MKDMAYFVNLVDEAKKTRDNIGEMFNEAYYAKQDTTRLQRLFDKATDRILRRMGYVWLLDQAKNFKE
jgi:hypothetical protein